MPIRNFWSLSLAFLLIGLDGGIVPAASATLHVSSEESAALSSEEASEKGDGGGSTPRPLSLIEVGLDAVSAVGVHGAGEREAFSFALPHLDAATITMMCCLLGVPMVTATVAFLIVEVGLRGGSEGWESSPRRPSAAWYGNSGLAANRMRPFTGTGASLTPSSVARAPMQTGRFGPGSQPTFGEVAPFPYTNGALTEPPSLPGTNTWLRPYGAMGPQVPEEEPESPRKSPLSTALLVKNPAGVAVKLDSKLRPHAERRTVDLISVKDGTAVLTAHLTEHTDSSSEPAWIRMETKAKGIPVAMLDTSGTIFPVGGKPPPPDRRKVILHRVSSEDSAEAGAACAWIAPSSDGYNVHYTVGEVGIGLTVQMGLQPGVIDSIMDAQGTVVAKADGGDPRNLWVRQGTDMALISCVMIAVQKLGG